MIINLESCFYAPTALLVAVKAEEDAAGLEVWLFEEPDADGERTAYVHHDIPLPSFPLAVAWMRFNPTGLLHSVHHITHNHISSFHCTFAFLMTQLQVLLAHDSQDLPLDCYVQILHRRETLLQLEQWNRR